ncbi:MAG: carboxymuconolactone decarboxylase family protein [Rhodospirillaceae bacterium]|nr:carboxymuconolactone decarboxylase family protein [Rhodospirillaceae bacterium]
MARIDYADPATKTDRARDLLDKLDHKNIFRMLAHSPSHFERYVKMGHAIRYRGELDPQLREIAITRTGILCGSEYEVVAHKRIGKAAGVSDEKTDALETGADSAAFTEVEKDVLRFTDEVVRTDSPTDATFNAVARHMTPGAMVELHLAIGFYIMTSKFLVTFGVDMQTS